MGWWEWGVIVLYGFTKDLQSISTLLTMTPHGAGHQPELLTHTMTHIRSSPTTFNFFLPSIPDITQNPRSPTAAWVQHNITQENKKGVSRGQSACVIDQPC